MAKHNFKVGDSVMTVRNPAWGMKPMTIESLRERGATCKNPEFSGHGYFDYDELVKSTPQRKEKLRQLAAIQREAKEVEKQLFGKWAN